jgi:pimeloyl-ACP methyl ester carboxylesterase
VLRVARFLRSYAWPGTATADDEVVLPTNDGEIAATLLRPRGEEPVAGWIVLHGLTVPGRHHPALVRFASALAASGAAVLIPEISPWRRLRIESGAAESVIEASIGYLRSRPDIRGGGLNLVGFSFGGAHGLIAASRPGIRDSIRGVVAFGAFCDLARTTRFMLTGEHEWQGVQRRSDPDPYGRWILVGNYLRDVPEYQHMQGVAEAALRLAEEAGRCGIYAAEPYYDDLKASLRTGLPPDERRMWDLIAPVGDHGETSGSRIELAERIAAAALANHSVPDPLPFLERLDQRIVLAHGLDDRLIPYTETLRLRAAMPPSVDARVFLTRMFAHSSRDTLSRLQYPREVVRYISLLRSALQPA